MIDHLGQKIIFHCQLTNLGMEFLNGFLRLLSFTDTAAEYVSSTAKQLLFPFRNLIGMDIKLFDHLRHG